MPGLLLDQPEGLGQTVAEPLAGIRQPCHQLPHEADRARIAQCQEGHRHRLARHELLLALFAQEIAHGDRDVAKVDVDRTGLETFVADRAVIGDVVEFVEMLERDAAPSLLFVQEGFDQ